MARKIHSKVRYVLLLLGLVLAILVAPALIPHSGAASAVTPNTFPLPAAATPTPQ